MTAACMAWMASLVALPVSSPLTTCSIRALRLFSCFLSKISLRRSALFARERRTTVRGSTSPVSPNTAPLSLSINSRSGFGSISG